ncbi:MAG: helix-turn-helix domain-containing protein [Eubacterium sp.]|nr:helix-turn-helix domain-containing protein [Eubacterium sp.]
MPKYCTALYDESLNKDMLNNLCKVFHCEISDILEYVPDKDEKQT